MKIANCPICHNHLEVKELHCPHCDLSLRGSFESSWFAALNAQQLDFVRLFLMVQGNIKEMEKRLNISYPTVKNRLAEIIRQIKGTEPEEADFSDIINDLDEGFISVDEALTMIQTRRTK